MVQTMKILVTSLLVAAFVALPRAQAQIVPAYGCATITTQSCSCPGGGGLVASVCDGGGTSAFSQLSATCCHGKFIATCYDEGACPFSRLLKRLDNDDSLTLYAMTHLVMIPDCSGSLHPVATERASLVIRLRDPEFSFQDLWSGTSVR